MASLLKRLFSRKESAVGHLLSLHSVGRAVFPPRNYENYAKEAYKLNSVAYRCIALISSCAASVPWLLYTEDGEEVIDHPLLDVLQRPNPMQTGKELFTGIYAYDLLVGDSYLERVLVDNNATLKELYSHRPDRMKVVPGRFGTPQAFEYSISNTAPRRFDVDPVTGKSDVLHVLRFNPLNDWYGQSPLEAVGMSVDSHNEATRWNYAVLKNGARPSGALEFEGELADEQFNQLKQEIEQGYSGARRGRPMLLTGGLKWVEMMLSQKEMDWARGKEVSAREIAVSYCVPEQLVGIPGQQTFNNYREARLALYEDAVLPLLDRYSEALTNWFRQLVGFEGLRVGYDVDQIPALSLRREQQWDRVQNAAFLTLDEKREALGYEPYEPDANNPASQLFIEAGKIPLDMVGDFSAGPASTDPNAQDPAQGDQPAPQDAPAGDGQLPATDNVQGLALNGAQIQAVLQLIQAVADKVLPPESAIRLILVAFPTIDEATATAMVQPAVEFEPPKPEPDPNLPPDPNADPNADPKKPDPNKDPKKYFYGVVINALQEQKRIGDLAQLAKAYSLAYGKGVKK